MDGNAPLVQVIETDLHPYAVHKATILEADTLILGHKIEPELPVQRIGAGIVL